MTAIIQHDRKSEDFPPCLLPGKKYPQHHSGWEHEIEKGFRISSFKFCAEEEAVLEYERTEAAVLFGFILSGSYSHQVIFSQNCKQQFFGHVGTSGLAYLPPSTGAFVVPRGSQVHVVHIHLSLPLAREILPCDNADSARFEPIQRGSLRPYVSLKGMTIAVRETLARLLQGPVSGAPPSLFFKGIALELIAGQIGRFTNSLSGMEAIPLHNQAQLLLARDLLTCDLSSPPSLKQLARKTGLNVNKLQHGFNQLCGLSVYKYLQQCRMIEANRLFHESEMNVGQVASSVGYTNASHFSSAYKQHFGILPREHMGSIRSHSPAV